LVVDLDLLGQLKDPVGNLFGGGTTVVTVELDTEIVVGSTRVVGSGEQNSTVRLSRPDHGRSSRGGENGVLTDDQLSDTVTGGDPDDLLNGFGGLDE
jgi:Ca2+-binding RTX toxin-like protein